MKNAEASFACNVFNQQVMRERLPKDVYKKVMQTKEDLNKLSK